MTEWIDNRKDATKSEEIAERLIPMMEACNCPICQQILELKHYLIKKSIWIIGGDGWAYDIGFGGLDHVIASGKNVNILVLDTEVYSNTGGQSSKSTPIGAVAKFASAGKRVRKKDLGAMAMTYSYVYVAQVAMGANHNQYFQAIKEAEAYNGPSLIIAYAPCINHGIKGGMGLSQMTEKQAVESGYWHLWRYNPTGTRQESVHPRLEGTGLVEIPGIHPQGSALHFVAENVPERGRRVVRSLRVRRQMALRHLQTLRSDGLLERKERVAPTV